MFPYPDMPMAFRRVGVKEEAGYLTWYGTQPEIPDSGLVVVSDKRGGQTAIMVTPRSGQFTFNLAANGVVTVQPSPPAAVCGVVSRQADDGARRVVAASAVTAATPYPAAAQASASVHGGPSGMPLPADSGTLFVGVLFIYSQATVEAARANHDATDPEGFIDRYSKACLEQGNVVLNNSEVTNFQWKYLGAVPHPGYGRPAGANLDFDLAAISPGGVIGSWVATQAYNRGAGQVLLWNSGDEPAATAGGLANAGDSAPVTSGDNARALVMWQSTAPSYVPVIHELSHNFGCMHDRYNAYATLGGSASAPDGDGRYNYGSLWRLVFQTTAYTIPAGSTRQDYPNGNVTFTLPDGSQVNTWSRDVGYGSAVIGARAADGSISVTNTFYDTAGTIMAYAGSIIPYFSNPNVTVHVDGELTGRSASTEDWGTVPTGRPLSDPRAAYNAKVLQDGAGLMSTFGSGISFPLIVGQPQGVSVTAGDSFVLTVSATGGALTYQWYRDGTAITAANTSTYTKYPATTSDAGSYTVAAGNSLGAVTSSPAEVKVSVAPAPPSTGCGGSSGGGGGGGSMDPFFLLGLTAIAVLRWKRRPFGIGPAGQSGPC